MATEIAKLYASVGADTAKFDKGMSGVKKQIGVVGKSFGGLKTAVAGLGLAFGAVGAVQLGRMAVDMARAGADAATLEQSFDRLAMGVGESASSMLQAMRAASRGMVSDNDLILSANKAMLLGVADSGEELGQLLEVARVRGQAMGLTLTQAFNDIVTGIGRMSPMILDNLGIVTGGQKVFDDYAASIGKAGDALSDTEKKQALLGAVVASTADMIADSEGNALTAAEAFQSFDAATQNLNLAIGKLLNSQPVIDFMVAFAESVNNVADTINAQDNIIAESSLWRLGPLLSGLAGSMNELSNARAVALVTQNVEALAATESSIDMLNSRIGGIGKAYNEAAAITGAPLIDIEALHQGEVAFLEVGDAAITAASDLEVFNGKVDELMAKSGLRSFAIGIIDEVGAKKALAIYESSNAILRRNTEEWVSQGIAGDELLFKQKELESILTEGYDTQRKMTEEARKTATAVSKVSDAYDDIKSKVASILSGAIGPVAGVDAEDLLPREDKINENARRLASIAVDGLNPMAEWFDEFAMEAPETFKAITESADPQGTARLLLKDFQDGLNPELIDKNLAVELVNRAFRADAATEQLIADVAQQYADTYGVSLAQATEKAQEVLGGTADGGTITAPEIVTDTGAAMDTGDAAGVAYGQGMLGAVAALGASITTSLSSQLQAENNLTAIGNAGTTQGTKWGNEFLAVVGENVPAQLIGILVDLVTPGVEANINTNAGLNGAAA